MFWDFEIVNILLRMFVSFDGNEAMCKLDGFITNTFRYHPITLFSSNWSNNMSNSWNIQITYTVHYAKLKVTALLFA